MFEIPLEVLYAAELAKTRAWAPSQIAYQGRTLRGVCVTGIPRGTHLAWILSAAGFDPKGSGIWVWMPGLRLNRMAN